MPPPPGGGLLRFDARNDGDGTRSSSLRVTIESWRGNLVAGPTWISMDKTFFIHIMTNPRKTVLYTGMTNNLSRRVYEHKEKFTSGFAAKYNVTDLVYYEIAATAEAAIAREKQIKAYSRRRKIELVNKMNPAWRDLSTEL